MSLPLESSGGHWDLLYTYCELAVSFLLLFVISADKMTTPCGLFSISHIRKQRLRMLFLCYKSLTKPDMPKNKACVFFQFSCIVFWILICGVQFHLNVEWMLKGDVSRALLFGLVSIWILDGGRLGILKDSIDYDSSCSAGPP